MSDGNDWWLEDKLAKGFSNLAAAVITLSGLTAAILITNPDDKSGKGAPPSASATEDTRAKAARERAEREMAEACRVLSDKRSGLARIFTNRRKILERLSEVGGCTDPNAPREQLIHMCRMISAGITSNRSRWRHPILHPFYTMLYSELKCVERGFTDDRKSAVDDLLKTLESTEMVKKYPLLDPESPLNEQLCRRALAFVNNPTNRESIVVVRDYLLENSPSLPADSEVKQMIDKLQANPARIEEQLKLITTAAAFPALCMMEPSKIIQWFDKTGTFTGEMLTQKRRLALPVVRELLKIAKDEPDEEKARRVTGALLTLAQNLSAEQQR